ncbi:MAG TPA: hypothetical protein V6D33_13160 [Cyanophyceae cyanobacterium]
MSSTTLLEDDKRTHLVSFVDIWLHSIELTVTESRTVERLFQFVTETSNYEIKTLAYFKAAWFSFVNTLFSPFDSGSLEKVASVALTALPSR